MLGQISELEGFPYTRHLVIIGRPDYQRQDVDVVLWSDLVSGPVKFVEDEN